MSAPASGFVQLAAHNQVQLVIVQLNRRRLVARVLRNDLVFRLMLVHDVDPQMMLILRLETIARDDRELIPMTEAPL
jgi:hypothetical protein